MKEQIVGRCSVLVTVKCRCSQRLTTGIFFSLHINIRICSLEQLMLRNLLKVLALVRV